MAPDLDGIMSGSQGLGRNEIATVRSAQEGYTIGLEQEPYIPSVELIVAPCDPYWGIIHVRNETRGLFRGYRGQFILETDVKPFVMHLTGAADDTPIGENTGGYIGHPGTIEPRLLQHCPDSNTREGSFKRFYEAHPEMGGGSIIRIGRLAPERYRILEIRAG